MSSYFIKSPKGSVLKEILRWVLTPLHAFSAGLIILFYRKPERSYKYEVAICGLFKNEGRFLKEWLDFHIAVGVDHFYMYNNNSDDNYLDVLKYYMENGIVELIDWPQKFPQMPAYKHCFNKAKNETKWLGYIDIDEFVCPKSESNIKDWLIKYKKYPSVLLYWKVFGTSGILVHNDNQLVMEQYTACYDKPTTFSKLFINTSFNFSSFNSPHIINATINLLGFSFYIPPINEYKKFICFGLHRVPLFNNEITAQINHYWSKAYDVFVYNKTVRSDVFSADNEKHDKYSLLEPSENLCIAKDYTIHKYLLKTKLMNK